MGTELEELVVRVERLENRGVVRRARLWLRDLTDLQLMSFITLSLAGLVIFLLLEPMVAGASATTSTRRAILRTTTAPLSFKIRMASAKAKDQPTKETTSSIGDRSVLTVGKT